MSTQNNNQRNGASGGSRVQAKNPSYVNQNQQQNQPYPQQQQPNLQQYQPYPTYQQPSSHIIISQQLPVVNQVIVGNLEENEYTRNVLVIVLVYYFFFIGCIGVEYGLYGSKQAADLWVSSYVFLGVTLALFFIIKQNPLIWLFGIQAFFLCLSCILEIAAFAKSVQHPVLYYYNYSNYNDRRLLTTYSYSKCQDYKSDYSSYTYQDRYAYYCDPILKDYSNCKTLYNELSYADYNRYFSYYCDYILGFSSNYDSSRNGDYGACLYMKEKNSSYYYEYFETTCEPILDKWDGNSNYNNYYDNNCVKNGSYDPYTDYCYSQQYAFMVYFVINFISYLVMWFILGQRIYRFFIFIKNNPRIAPQAQIISV